MNAKTLVQTAGITYRQLDTWTGKGWLHPWHDGGTGTFREYPAGEVRVAVLMGRLTRAGLTAEAAARAARALGEDGRVVLGDGLVLVVDVVHLTMCGADFGEPSCPACCVLADLQAKEG